MSPVSADESSVTGAWAIVALAALLAEGDAPTGEGDVLYENARCGLTLTLPPGWTASEIKAPISPTRCAFGLSPANWKLIRKRAHCSAGDHAIYVSLFPGTIERLAEDLGLVKENGEWLVDGRAGATSGTRSLKHPMGRALLGSSEVGCYGRGRVGHYKGMAETDVAFVESGRRVVEFVADVNLNIGGARSPFDAIVQSLRLSPRRTGR